MPQAEVRHKPLPKQIEFLKSTARNLIYSGSWGAGKSRALAFKIVIRVSKPGSREGLCRKTLQSLKGTTLKTLLEPEGDLPPVLPPGTYEHNKQEHTIKVHGGGEIIYFGVADRVKDGQPVGVGSLNLSGCGIDEWVELDKNETKWIKSRVRMTGDGLTRQIYGACNPGGPLHYLAQDFGLSPGNDPNPNHHAVRTCSSDNPYLPQDYRDELDQMTGLDRLRFRDGLWAAQEGVVYNAYFEPTHVQDRVGPWSRAVLAVDEGFTNPFAAVLMLMDSDGRIHIAEEHYERKMNSASKRAKLAELSERARSVYGVEVEAEIVDPSAAGFIDELRQWGHPAVPANNEVLDGIRRVQDRLIVQDDGYPRLTIATGCRMGRMEFGSYAWKKNNNSGDMKDQPVKDNDHEMDAIRYGVAYFDSQAANAARIVLI